MVLLVGGSIYLRSILSSERRKRKSMKRILL
jgi:hypothetical protein